MITNFIFDFGGVILDINMKYAFDAFYSMGFCGNDKDIKNLDSLYQTGKISTQYFS